MTPLQWVLLCVLFTLYLLLGGSVFMYFEQYREIEKKEEISVLRKDIKEILLQLDNEFYHNDTTYEVIHALRIAKEGVLNRIATACEISEGLIEPDEPAVTAPTDVDNDRLKWNFYNSVFFAFTVLTTIGYGHLSPSTNWSKWFVMLYALIGIPLTTMLLSGLGDYFSSKLTRVHRKSKDKKHKSKCSFILKILYYLVPGLIVFIIFPAGIFVLIESWTFLDALYYAFVTLSTIGFGDYVAGMGTHHHSVWMGLYKAVIIIWIVFGLGYFIMILSFVAKGLTHKKVRIVLEKRINNTREKLSRDIDYMRRVVNELYLMKINPVYEVDQENEEDFKKKAKRTQSQPCISFEKRCSSLPRLGNLPTFVPPLFGASLEPTVQGDGKNNSKQTTPKLTRRCSDSDLSNINRDKTFESAVRNFVTADELLVTVVNALSGNVMHDVMEAVEELNHYEEEDEDDNDAHGNRKEADASRFSEEDFGFEDVPSWDLGTLSESDEEVLIGDDEDNGAHCKLEQVVVHDTSNAEERGRKSSGLMGKVTGAIRKISSGNRSPSDGPSRKVSRNDSDRKRKISRSESFERLRRVSGQKSSHFLNPHAYCTAVDGKNSHHAGEQRKISEESRTSRSSNRSIRSVRNAFDETPQSNAPSRKSTSGSDPRSSSKISLETTSLAEFLKALDSVHSRLNAKTSTQSTATDSSRLHDDLHGHHGFHVAHGQHGFTSEVPPKTPRTRRLSTDASHNRRRKMGMIHPDFSYVNYGFSGQESDKKTKEKHPPDRK